MRRFTTTLLCLLLLSTFSAVLAQTDAPAALTVDALRLNVRAAPTTGSAILTRVNRGEQWPVLSTSADGLWYEISVRGQTGFVSAAYVTVQAVEPSLNSLREPCLADPTFADAAGGLCPTAEAVATDAAYQPFEFGFMIWLRSTGNIYVFPDDAGLRVIPEHTYVPQAEPDSLEPPPGLYQPQHGFGHNWFFLPGVRRQLGWATEPETGYVARVQRALFQADGAPALVVTRQDGGALALNLDTGDWFQLPWPPF